MNGPRLLTLLAALTLLLAVGAGSAYGHAERLTYYPNYKLGKVPKYRTTGKSLVVCKADSGQRIRRLMKGKAERRNLELLDRCRFRHIQAAVDAAKSNYRILILPASRRTPVRRMTTPRTPRTATGCSRTS